ncbi:serine hydrolase domain-containing protein [Streptomyces mangrovisoli]|uniref:Serine hydrolase n=1 Tax=Streptomyces mangrovisoli TaxID=1428628 RepID=A0A1J4NWW9_9ACTN|nr:serine hydrolase [Streptomyces mangrovisoli]OIJ66546.1 serine hydrolase [Streptomyces mangrovisoli]
MSDRPWPTSAPAEQGVDASGVLAFLDAVEAAPGIEPHSLMIVRHGHLVASGWWAPYTPERPHLLYSLSKSFTGTAAALAAAEGLLDLDDPVISHFPEFEADITDPRSRALRVRHVASMASGHVAETLPASLAADAAEPVRGFLLVPPERDPGTVFAYNQPTTYTLAAIVQKATGQPLTEWLRPRLLDPLGIGDVRWLRDRTGREIGYSGLHARTDAIARLGELYLRRGQWRGERLLPADWVADASRAHIPTGDGSKEAADSDWGQGYGLQFWRSRHGFRGDGAYGQFCLVLPQQDAVIATTADTERMQALLDLVWAHLLPAFGTAPPTGAGERDAALADRLADLALPPAPGASVPPARADAWHGARFTPSGGGCPAQPRLTDARVTSDADGWSLVLTEADEPLRLPFGAPGWTVTEDPLPLAISGGWTSPDTLSLDVAFLETPHHLLLTCSLPDAGFTARWRTTPLHPGRLRSQRATRGRD